MRSKNHDFTTGPESAVPLPEATQPRGLVTRRAPTVSAQGCIIGSNRLQLESGAESTIGTVRRPVPMPTVDAAPSSRNLIRQPGAEGIGGLRDDSPSQIQAQRPLLRWRRRHRRLLICHLRLLSRLAPAASC